MYEPVNFSTFTQRFHQLERDKHFSYEGMKALFAYLEEYEESTGEAIELDVIALCCEYAEYDSLESLQADYPDIASMEELEENTQVIPFDGGFIIYQF